jgi:hypothetical protein
MKDIIRSAIVLITFVTIVFAFSFWGVSNEVVKDIFALFGAIAVSALITVCLSIFIDWLSRPYTEEKSGNNSVDEKPS